MSINSDNVSYQPNIPNAKDSFSKSQTDFLNNFSTLFAAFSANHVPLNDPSLSGNHTVINLPSLEEETQIQTGVGQVSLSGQYVTDKGSQLFLTTQGNTQTIPLTCYQIYALNPLNKQNRYFTILPGNVIMYFGTLKITNNQATNPNYINLNPVTAKNIITINFRAMAFAGQPTVDTTVAANVVPIKNGASGTLYDKVLVAISLGNGRVATGTFGYIVLGNI